MKKLQLFFAFILVPLDFLMLLAAGLSAYYIRFAPATANLRPIIFSLKFSVYLPIVGSAAVAWLIIFAIAGLYNLREISFVQVELRRIVLACSLGFVLVLMTIFSSRELFSSRFIILAAWLFAIIYVMIGRSLIRILQRYLYSRGIGTHKVVLVGASQTTENLVRAFAATKSSGYEVVKRYDDFSLDNERALAELIKVREIDELIQADPNLSKADILRLYDFSDEHHLIFKYAADLLNAKVLRVEVQEVAGVPIVEVKKTPLDGWGRIIKRTIDIIGAVILIIITSPILLITAIIIKLDSRGPIIYKNERAIKRGTFKLFKFRSMSIEHCVGDDYDNNKEALDFEQKLIATQNTKSGPVYKIGADPRVTRAGRFIRRWSIDELPQFFNVFLGNMSLVGPRPHQPREVEKYQRWHKKVLTVKPGMTGLAQVSGRSDLNFDEEAKLDLYYIENWSLLQDLIILFKTPLAVFKSRQAE